MIKIFNSLLLKWAVVGFFILLGALVPLCAFADWTAPFTDDFEAYNLVKLTGQGGWVGNNYCIVVDDQTYSGTKAVMSKYGTDGYAYKDFDVSTRGIISFWFLDVSSGGQAWELKEAGGATVFNVKSICNLENCALDYFDRTGGYWKTYTNFDFDKWHNLQIRWFTETETFYYSFNFDFEGWQEPMSEPYYDDVARFKMTFYADNEGLDMILGEAIEPQMEIKGISPDSGTVITNLDTNLTIEYKLFDWEIYDGFIVNFKNNKTGIFGNSIQFLEADLDPSGTGSKTINLENFGIDYNGRWNLTGIGFGSHLDIEGGMFITTRGWVDFWTDDLVSTPYYLLFDVEELSTPYTFTTAEAWYSANVERFATSTQLFNSFVGLLSPIFEKVGDFGFSVQGMFDQDEAYDRGYGLGEIFPLLNGYVQKIDLFFGGFPLVSFFKYLILVMLAIFIIRIVMKFIPFLG